MVSQSENNPKVDESLGLLSNDLTEIENILDKDEEGEESDDAKATDQVKTEV